MNKKKFSIFWLIIVLLIIAYAAFWIISIATIEPPPPDADAGENLGYGLGRALSIILAIVLAPIYLALLSIASIVREILFYKKGKTSKKRLTVMTSILSVVIVAGLVFLIAMIISG